MRKSKLLIANLGALGGLAVLLWVLTRGSPGTPALAQATIAAGTADDELVYLDKAGYIHVLDPDVVARPREIQWVSPEGDWRDITLGDFNGDQDYEIAAIGVKERKVKLAIYDPVVVDPVEVDVNKNINEIPWNILFYTATISSTLNLSQPLRIAAGNFNPTIPGDELLFSIPLTTETQTTYIHNKASRLMLWHRLTTTKTKQFWQPQIPPIDFDHVWNALTVGQIDNLNPLDDPPEIVLIDDVDGAMDVYRLAGNQLARLYTYESDSRPWYAAAIGQTHTGDFSELVAVRESPKGLPNMFIFDYRTVPDNDNYFKDRLTDYFDPSATVVVLANVNGFAKILDGGVLKDVDDDEIYMLRSLPTPRPPNPQTAPHLFMRNPGEDKNVVFKLEVVLDADNKYQALVGLEVDADGRDEIAIMRDTLIRIYVEPNVNSTNVREYKVASDGKTLRAANLDRGGHLLLPKIAVRPGQLTPTLAAGATAEAVITVTNAGNIENVPFNIYLSGSPSWLRASPLNGLTPAQITIYYDAYGLPPVGEFLAVIDIVPNHPQVLGRTVGVPVRLRTTPGLWPVPERVVGLVDCTTLASKSYRVRVAGLLGVPYSANLNNLGMAQSLAQEPITVTTPLTTSEEYTVPLLSTVPWATLSAIGTLLPTTFTIQFNPNTPSFTGSPQGAVLGISANNNQGRPSSIVVPVAIDCQRENYYLPWVARR